jgi:hypothetical protein
LQNTLSVVNIKEIKQKIDKMAAGASALNFALILSGILTPESPKNCFEI